MKIQNKNTNYSKYSFKGTPYAKITVKNIKKSSDLVIYHLEKTDKTFLNKMIKKLNLSKLAPEVRDKEQLETWKDLIKEAAARLDCNEDVFLAVNQSNKKPCGILSELVRFEPAIMNEARYISYFATWPDKKGHNTKCAGKSLIRVILDRAQKEGKSITLIPSATAPKNKRSCEQFYANVGFANVEKSVSSKKIIYNDDVYSTIKKIFDPIIEYKKIENANSENLEETLNINYPTNVFDKIFSKFNSVFRIFIIK